MSTFKIIFRTGRVQTLRAEGWNRDAGVIRFRTDIGEAPTEFVADALVTIEEVEPIRSAYASDRP